MAFSNPKKNDRSLKRGRTEVLSKEKVFETFPKFLVIHSDNDKEPITSKSVFKIAKSLERSIGKEYQAKNLASGDLLIEVQTKAQSEELQKQKEIAEQSVTITPHRTLNCVQGVISEKQLTNETDADILENLRSQGVSAVRRITIRRANEEIKTKHIVITFNRSSLPERVNVAYISCPVRAYVPNPRRCFKCQRYGHGSQSCRGKVTCAKCAEHDHPSENCDKTVMKCPNCSGAHAAYSRSCETFKKEKEIIQLKVKENLTFPEARRKHALFSGTRYADAARRGAERRLVSTGCQYSFADLALPLAPREQPPAAQKAPAVEARAPKPTKVPQVGSLVESTAAPAVPAVRAPTDSVPPKSATPSGTQLERVPSVSRLSEEAMDTTPSTSGTPTPKHPPLPTGRGKAGRQPVAAPGKGT